MADFDDFETFTDFQAPNVFFFFSVANIWKQAAFRSIFINDVRPHNSLNHDQVLEFLKKFGALEREYLDFIVNVSKAPDAK